MTDELGSGDAEPTASAPDMPGYDMMLNERLIPWAWAKELLEQSRNYWLATARPSGAPHVMPVWGIWLEGRFCFSTGSQSRKARNLAANPRCVVTTEHGDEAVIVEGTARVLERVLVERFCDVYSGKYQSPMNLSYEPFFEVLPETVFGFMVVDPPATSPYGATRWTFSGH